MVFLNVVGVIDRKFLIRLEMHGGGRGLMLGF
jgi:hypothetical protein